MSAWLVLALLAAEVDASRVDFDTQVMPILTKSGCNAGACHGAAAGRGGFHLSLYGSRPHDDFLEITMALEGRRINHNDPDRSLLLQKPTEQQSHEGGTRIDLDGPNYQTISRWIKQGADRGAGRKLVGFAFTANGAAPKTVGDHVQLVSRATFDDGSEVDALPWTVVTPDDPSAVRIDADGTLTMLRSGRQILVARYLDRVVPLEIVVPLKTDHADQPITSAENHIDRFIDARLHQLNLRPTTVANDATLTRRLCLDLTGRLPLSVLPNSQSSMPYERGVLIDELVASEAFNELWAHRLSQLLEVQSLSSRPEVARKYHSWLRSAVANDEPFNEVVQKLLLSEGEVAANPPASFYTVRTDPREMAEFFSRAFLGVRLQCANCHDHPLDAWTQDDYHGLAAIFAGVRSGPVVTVSQLGEVIHPATGDPAEPKIPGGAFLQPNVDYRRRLSEWLTSEDNAWFAKSAVNRIWKHLMGRGLVEPVDDLRVTNPATHPELLEWLTQEFISNGFRAKPIIKRICLSDAYARASRPVPGQPDLTEYYASAIGKPMTAEVLLDAVADVTGVSVNWPEAATERAVSVTGLVGQSTSLDLLGRCSVSDNCNDASSAGDDLSVQLHLLNGGLLNERLSDADGYLMKIIADGIDAETLVKTLYSRAYSRAPSKQELAFWLKQFPRSPADERFANVAQDFVWSLLNSDEFTASR